MSRTKFQVCPHCQGTGTSCAYLGAFSAEDMDEQGEDFREDYVSGAYDRTCEYCNGKRVVDAARIRQRTSQRADARLAWQEDGCPGGSFDEYWVEG